MVSQLLKADDIPETKAAPHGHGLIRSCLVFWDGDTAASALAKPSSRSTWGRGQLGQQETHRVQLRTSTHFSPFYVRKNQKPAGERNVLDFSD